MINQKITIIAGPCSVDEKNIEDLLAISKISVVNSSNKKQRAVWGLRVVGLKSRTSFDKKGQAMGLDFQEYTRNLELINSGLSVSHLKMLPSIVIAEKILKETGLTIATEIVDPLIQLPLYERIILSKKLMMWNPATNQLGWQMYNTGIFARKNSWFIGIKNAKWLGEHKGVEINSMEKSWIGQFSYAVGDKRHSFSKNVIMIHRGVDISDKGQFRNALVHDSAEKVKTVTGAKMFFDPSHSLGPLLRHKIVEETILAMQMKTMDGTFLYDGILIEVGNSKTDTEQHISIKELEEICNGVAKFRTLSDPDKDRSI